jgi:hypothetical protein
MSPKKKGCNACEGVGPVLVYYIISAGFEGMRNAEKDI